MIVLESLLNLLWRREFNEQAMALRNGLKEQLKVQTVDVSFRRAADRVRVPEVLLNRRQIDDITSLAGSHRPASPKEMCGLTVELSLGQQQNHVDPLRQHPRGIVLVVGSMFMHGKDVVLRVR